MEDYRPGQQVHWIQARKATEDYESWREATVDRVDGTVITVTLEGADHPAHFESVGAGHLARSGHDRLWVSERWSVLAYPDLHGNTIGIQPPGKNPDSVFDRAGTQRLRYLSIKRLEPAEYVYAAVTGIDGNDYFFVLPRPDAEEVADIMRVMNSCKTWGEVRRAASLDRYKEILGVAGYGSLEEYVEHIFVGRPIPGALQAAAQDWEEKNWENGLPADDDPFDPMEIDSYHSGDYPPTFECLQNSCLPQDLLAEFAERFETSINGTFATIPPDKGPQVVAELERRGHRCVEETDLFRRSMVRW
jgi:hypothetical protein